VASHEVRHTLEEQPLGNRMSLNRLLYAIAAKPWQQQTWLTKQLYDCRRKAIQASPSKH
jgi:hypothetical protein